MSNCTCGQPNLSNPVCPVCQPDEFAMIPIERQTSSGNCFGQGGNCEDTDKWFDEVTTIFQVPAVTDSIAMNVCDPSRYSVGQWIYLLGAGRFFITSINPTAQTITVRNSCTDGSAISGNSSPGTAVQSGTPFWIIDEPSWPHCYDPDEACEDTIECIAATEDLCLTNIPTANETDEYHLFGGSGIGCEQDEESVLQSCLNKLVNVFYKAGALCYRARSSIGGNKVDDNGTPRPLSFVVNNPSCGCDIPLDEVDADFSGMWRYNNGNLELASGGLFEYKNELVHEDDYLLTAGTQSVGPFILPDYPGDGAVALLHARVWATTNTSGDLFQFELKLEGHDMITFGANEQFNQEPPVPFPGHNDNCIPVQTLTESVSGQLQQINASVGGTANIKIWLRGYYI